MAAAMAARSLGVSPVGSTVMRCASAECDVDRGSSSRGCVAPTATKCTSSSHAKTMGSPVAAGGWKMTGATVLPSLRAQCATTGRWNARAAANKAASSKKVPGRPIRSQ